MFCIVADSALASASMKSFLFDFKIPYKECWPSGRFLGGSKGIILVSVPEGRNAQMKWIVALCVALVVPMSAANASDRLNPVLLKW
jgi:hypothetical protein